MQYLFLNIGANTKIEKKSCFFILFGDKSILKNTFPLERFPHIYHRMYVCVIGTSF
jgi:hypothetical protein